MKKKKIKKQLKSHLKWLKDISGYDYGNSKVKDEIKVEINQIKWILKMFKK
jgi:hypothetical protein